MRKQWLDVIKKKRPEYVLKKYSFICSRHFAKTDFIGSKYKSLKLGAQMIDDLEKSTSEEEVAIDWKIGGVHTECKH
jgi:hypothetical protein